MHASCTIDYEAVNLPKKAVFSIAVVSQKQVYKSDFTIFSGELQ